MPVDSKKTINLSEIILLAINQLNFKEVDFFRISDVISLVLEAERNSNVFDVDLNDPNFQKNLREKAKDEKFTIINDCYFEGAYISPSGTLIEVLNNIYTYSSKEALCAAQIAQMLNSNSPNNSPEEKSKVEFKKYIINHICENADWLERKEHEARISEIKRYVKTNDKNINNFDLWIKDNAKAQILAMTAYHKERYNLGEKTDEFNSVLERITPQIDSNPNSSNGNNI